MLNATDQATFLSVRELRRSVQEAQKPLVYWIGAGTSKWLNYPLWKELARQLRREFSKFVEGYNNEQARKLIETNSFPAFFQRCRDLDQARYYRFLSNAFLPVPETALYTRFTEALGRTKPLHVLTTNIDEALERPFPGAGVYQRSDITGCLEQLQGRKPFIVKLHGSRSAIESAVFTTDDYEKLRSNSGYLSTLKHIFALGTVVFLGYSVSDQYLIDLLSDNAKDMSLFGPGPHFVVSPDFKEIASLRQIRYSINRFPDHRAALTVLDVIRQAEARKTELSAQVEPPPQQLDRTVSPLGSKTAYFISDVLPPGLWSNSTTAQITKIGGGLEAEMTLGLGFAKEELTTTVSTALHDLVVGLICFDFVYFPLSVLGKIHVLLGSEFFWQLVQADITRYVHLQHEPAILSRAGTLMGDIGLVSLSDSTGQAEPTATFIRRQIAPFPGKESVAEKQFSDLENKVIVFDEGGKLDLAGLVRASLMMPEVTRLLGIADAILPTQVPSWLKFPCLRMAHLVHTGAVCDRLGILAVKIPFGGARLTSAAFGIQPASESADQYASYVLSGRFNTDMGAALVGQPEIFQNILRFRDSAEGESFRKEVRDQLLANEASEFTASINAGLKRNIPIRVLEQARDKLSSLLTEKVKLSPVPAVWTNSFQSDDTTWLWRAKSRSLLLELTKKHGIRADDPCICGSGDMLRLCCALPLRE